MDWKKPFFRPDQGCGRDTDLADCLALRPFSLVSIGYLDGAPRPYFAGTRHGAAYLPLDSSSNSWSLCASKSQTCDLARAAVLLALHLARVILREAQGFWLARHLVSIVSLVDHCRTDGRLCIVLSAGTPLDGPPEASPSATVPSAVLGNRRTFTLARTRVGRA